MTYFLLSFITLINISLFVYLAVNVYRKKNKTKSQKRFFFVLLFGLIWILDTYLQGYETEYYNLLTHINYAFAVGIALFISTFAIHFPNEDKKFGPKKEFIFSMPAAIVFIFSFFDIWVKPIYFRQYEYTNWYFLYIAVLVIYFIAVPTFNLIKKRKQSTGILRMQINYFLFGYLISILILLAESFYINVVSIVNVTLDVLILNSSLLFIVFAFYSTIRYRFLDIALAIKRSAIRILTFTVIFGAYLFLLLSFQKKLNFESENIQTIFLFISVIVIVLTIEPIRKFIHNFVDKSFEKKDQKKEEIQKKLQFTFRSQQNVKNLIASAIEYIQMVFEVEQVQFIEKGDNFFNDKKEAYSFLKGVGRILIPEELPYRLEESEKYFFISKELEKVDDSAYLSIGQGDLFLGIFVLGKRKNKKAYTVEEVHELKHLQDEFTEALLNARLYQQAVERIKI